MIGAIVGLYWVRNPNAKLGIVSGLTVAFAGTLALFTNARRQDVFASTAAYAAVLVVFVSGNLATGTSDLAGSTSSSTQSSIISARSSTLFTTSTILATATITIATATSPSLETNAQAQATSSVAVATSSEVPTTAELIGIVLSSVVLVILVYLGFPKFRNQYCRWRERLVRLPVPYFRDTPES